VEYLAQNTYNELSQLSGKKVGGISPSTPLQNISYSYNIRGWMTKINDPANLNGKLFGNSIKYEQPQTTTWTPRYNGNISEVDWQTSQDGTQRRYVYMYDALNRLTGGYYLEPNSTVVWTSYYNEYYQYDLNGNIKTLTRFSKPSSGTTPEHIDDLVYNYTGNRLDKITLPTGVINNPSGYNALQNTIAYDLNGNMTSQLDKGIQKISYNFLNLPNYMGDTTMSLGQGTLFKYRADGIKIKKTYSFKKRGNFGDISYAQRQTDYLDGFQYLLESSALSCIGCPDPSPVLQFVPTSEGYFDFVKNKYIYNYVDHLGNTRLSYFNNGSSIEVLEENNYYPFGLKHEGYNALAGNSAYQYKYSGKELQETGMYDYGARFYMPDIGRWGVIDPLADKYQPFSGYNYVLNNPMSNIDPDGREVKNDYQLLKNGEVKLLKETQDKSDTLYASNDKGEVDKSKGSVTVKKAEIKDATIISDLSTNRKDEFGFAGSDLRLATTSNRTDALDVFQFAALNSTNEWSIQSNTINGKNEYALGTQLHPRLSPNYLSFDKLGYSSKTLNWDMHSHGAYLGTSGPSSGDTEHALTKSAARFLFRTNGNDRGKVYPYGKSSDNNYIFRQRRFDDMKERRFSDDYINFK